jgi:hypothetical protein
MESREASSMGEIAKLAKSICIVVTVLSVVMLIGVLVPDDTTSDSAGSSQPAPTTTPIESSVEDFVNVHRDGQDIDVECKRLSISGNNNRIWMTNDDVESIRVLGNNNWVAYPRNADPEIDDFGFFP